jgi:hypothetical protein
VALVWAGASGACLADGAKVTGGIEPVYTACLSAPSSCRSLVRAQFRIQYKPIAVRGFSLRIKLLRAYQAGLDDDKDDGSSEEQQASIFDPPFDVIDVKLRFSAPDGRDRLEIRAGYAYQHSDPNAVDGYHTPYLSGDYYFGPPIPSGWGGLSRRWDVLVKLSQDRYAMASHLPQDLNQFVSTYTVPLNNDGASQMYAAYSRELRFSGSDTILTPSNRFDLGITRYPTPWLELYGRISVYGTRGVPGTGKVVVGADVTI